MLMVCVGPLTINKTATDRHMQPSNLHHDGATAPVYPAPFSCMQGAKTESFGIFSPAAEMLNGR